MSEERSGPRSIIINRGSIWAAILLLILVLIMGAGALFSSYLEFQHYEQAQKQQGVVIEIHLCSTLDKLAAIKPPTGNPTTNPSRAYEVSLSSTLGELKTDLGCP